MYGSKKHSGFTLIEMIVSLGVFAVVITMAVGALLALVAANQELQEEQIVMTNLSFALDSMTREIRTGTRYHCDSTSSASGPSNMFAVGSDLDAITELTDFSLNDECPNGRQAVNHRYHGVAIIESGDSITSGAGEERILYYHYKNTTLGNEEGVIYRRISNESPIPITSDDIFVHEMEFFVTGIEPVSTGSGTYDEQPAVTIYIEASTDENTPAEDRYRLQTTVTQRTLDI